MKVKAWQVYLMGLLVSWMVGYTLSLDYEISGQVFGLSAIVGGIVLGIFYASKRKKK